MHLVIHLFTFVLLDSDRSVAISQRKEEKKEELVMEKKRKSSVMEFNRGCQKEEKG